MFTHIPKVGYVGVGTVSAEPQPFEDALLSIDGNGGWLISRWRARIDARRRQRRMGKILVSG